MKSLLLYDFVGLYLAILCNPYDGYPIASKNEDTCVFFYPFIHLCGSS